MKSFLKAIIKLAEECVVKVLEVNRDDVYKTLYLDKRETKSISPFLKDWVEEHIKNGLIQEEYIDGFKHVVNTDFAFKTFKYKKYVHFKMKRKLTVTSDYVESVITLIPKDKDSYYLIVYNIE